MRMTTESLARASSHRPWRTLVLWIVLIAVMGFFSSMYLEDALTTDADFTNEPEAKRALNLIEERFGEQGVTELLIVRSDDAEVGDPAYESFVRELQGRAAGAKGVTAAVSYYDTQDPSMVSSDGTTTLVPVTFEESDTLADYYPTVDELTEEAPAGFEVHSFGMISLNRDFSEIAEEDLRKGEGFGVLVALIVLVIVFGAVVAGLIPLAMGIASIAVAMGITALAGTQFQFAYFVTNMISMMGLAVGIDYSLFIVSRYREERAHGKEKLDAIAAAGATASRAVFFSGMTVVLALMGMLIIPTTIFRSLAAGAIFVVVVSVLASLTLLPALLSLLGDKINALRLFRRKESLGSDRHRFWDRIAHGVMARPVLSLLLGAGVLLASAVFYFDISTGFSGVSTLSDEVPSKQAFNVLAAEFSGGLDSPVEIVVDAPADDPAIQAAAGTLQERLEADPMFGKTSVRPNEAGDTLLISAPLKGDPMSVAATTSIERVRDDYVPAAFAGTDAEVLVGGDTAFNKDFFDLTDTYTPIVFAFVLGLSFLLLTVVFRSIVVPIKAILMNLVSVGASYGMIVLVFQKGFLDSVLPFQQVEVIEAWLPLFLFSVLFGLSMDYHVFLLSRIRERFDQTRDNAGSVAHGLASTGGIITGAAVIMVAVFSGFAAGDLVMMQQMGFGLAFAVLIDATVVRSILVPATMKLLGDRNWYLPKWLQWLPNVEVEGPAAREAPAASPAPEPV